MNTATKIPADNPVDTEQSLMDHDSNMFARFYFDSPFGDEIDFLAIRDVIDEIQEACEHDDGYAELVGVRITRDFFDLEISSTDPLNTQLALLDALDDVPFRSCSTDDDEDEWICDDCLKAMEAEEVKRAAQPKRSETIGHKLVALAATLKGKVTNFLRH